MEAIEPGERERLEVGRRGMRKPGRIDGLGKAERFERGGPCNRSLRDGAVLAAAGHSRGLAALAAQRIAFARADHSNTRGPALPDGTRRCDATSSEGLDDDR